MGHLDPHSLALHRLGSVRFLVSFAPPQAQRTHPTAFPYLGWDRDHASLLLFDGPSCRTGFRRQIPVATNLAVGLCDRRSCFDRLSSGTTSRNLACEKKARRASFLRRDCRSICRDDIWIVFLASVVAFTASRRFCADRLAKIQLGYTNLTDRQTHLAILFVNPYIAPIN